MSVASRRFARVLRVIVVAAIALPLTLRAQAPTVDGVRVRVVNRFGGEVAAGALDHRVADTLYLRARGGATLAVAVDHGRHVEESLGFRPRVSLGVAVGGFAGAIVGAIVFPRIWCRDDGCTGLESSHLKEPAGVFGALIGAAIGALVGAFVGDAFMGEVWSPVTYASDRDAALGPAPADSAGPRRR